MGAETLVYVTVTREVIDIASVAALGLEDAKIKARSLQGVVRVVTASYDIADLVEELKTEV